MTPIDIEVNGAPRATAAGATVARLLEELGVRGDAACAVEINGRVVPKSEHGARAVAAGDKIEVVTLAGGG